MRGALDGPVRNPRQNLRLRFRHPQEKPMAAGTVNGQTWNRFNGEWVELPGNLGRARIGARY